MWRNCCWNCEMMQLLWKTVQRFLKKLKIELSCSGSLWRADDSYPPAQPHKFMHLSPPASLLSLFSRFCPTLCDPTDCSPPGSSVLGISQPRILEWVATSFSTCFFSYSLVLPSHLIALATRVCLSTPIH